MSKTVQFKRGNANVSSTYVGAQGEITVNTDNYTLNVHDGVTAGGYTILNTNVSNIGNLVVTNQTITGTSPNTNITLSPNAANVVLTSNLVTPNIAINRYTIQSVNAGSSLTLPAETDGANVDLTNTYSNIRFTTYDPTTNAPYTLVLNTDSDVVFPGYIKSNLGGAEIQFAGGQGLLMYANFATGSTGISLNDTGTTDIFANVDLRLTTNYSGAGKQWLFGSNGTLSTTGNLSTANLSISHAVANNTVQVRTLANSDLKLVATDGIAQSAIYLWANNQRMSFNTVSNAFDFNFNGQLSATDFTASKNSAYGYSFYAAGGGYSGMRHTSGPPDYISIEHEGNIFAKFVANATVDIFGNLVISADGESFGTFPNAFVQVYANVDTYSQMVLQNINDGTSASTDVVVTADNGDDASYYINMGILGSNHAAPDFFGDTRSYDDGYLIVVGNDITGGTANVGNLIIGSTNGIVKTFVGNVAEANVVTTVSESLLTVAGNIIPAANVTYGLGTETNQWKDLWLSNTTLYMGGTAITVVDGTLSVGGNVIGGGGSNYGNSNVAAYLTVYNGSILTNTVNFSDSTVQTTAWKAGGNSAFTSNSVFVNNVSAGDFNNNGDFTVTFDAYTGGPALNFNASYQSPLNSNVGITVQAVNTPILMSTGNIELRANLSTAWTFGNDGRLSLPSGGNITGVTDSNSGYIKWIGNSSGDGNGYTTLELVPDDTLVNNNQYIIIDPTAPGHIHIRAGGTQDNSSADLILGGEYSYFKVAAGANAQTQINSNNHNWTFGVDGTFTLPTDAGLNGSQINSVSNSSGDLNGYTTLQLIPDVTLGTGTDQYLIIDPTAPGHIHIRAGGTQDNSNADLFLGGENSHFKVNAGANNEVRISANSHAWVFGADSVLTVPGEGVIRSIGDVVTLQSYNVGTGNVQSVYLGSGGGLGFFDQDIGGNWLEIFKSGVEPEIRVPVGRGNLNIQTAEGVNSYNWVFGSNGDLDLPGNITSLTGNVLVYDVRQVSPQVHLGQGAGLTNQGVHSIAVGRFAGSQSQGNQAVAVGQLAGQISQGNTAVAIGFYTAANTQSANAVAIGTYAGQVSQGQDSIAIGRLSGNSSQGTAAVSMGRAAGRDSQGIESVSIGADAGQTNQGAYSIAIGSTTAYLNQGTGAVAIGASAGAINQGNSAVAIGTGAGSGQVDNSIVVNANGSTLTAANPGLYIDPVRNDTSSNSQIVTYNTSTKELTYTDTISVTGNISAANINANVNGFSIGYRDVPQVIFTSNATLALTDAGKHYYSSNSANIITVPNNATVSFNIGTAISIVQQGTANLTITPGSGVTMYLAGNATSSSRLLGNYGMATLMKVGTDTWFINGTGLT